MYFSQRYTLVIEKFETFFNLKKKLAISNDYSIEIKLISNCCIIFDSSLIFLTSLIVDSSDSN